MDDDGILPASTWRHGVYASQVPPPSSFQLERGASGGAGQCTRQSSMATEHAPRGRNNNTHGHATRILAAAETTTNRCVQGPRSDGEGGGFVRCLYPCQLIASLRTVQDTSENKRCNSNRQTWLLNQTYVVYQLRASYDPDVTVTSCGDTRGETGHRKKKRRRKTWHG